MKHLKIRKETAAVGGVVVAIIIACYALSWLATCGIIKLITMCFGWTFKWSVATGIWLVMILLKTVLRCNE